MISTVPASPVVITQTNRKNRLFNAMCPAPERYRAAAAMAEDDDEDFVFDDDINDDFNDLPPDNSNNNDTNTIAENQGGEGKCGHAHERPCLQEERRRPDTESGRWRRA